MTLEKKTALVTGSSKGLGKSIAMALAAAGARVALVSRDRKRLDEVASEIRAAGGQADTFPTDVTDERQVRDLEKAVTKKLGRLQILVNNAGINVRKHLVDFTVDEWRRVIDTNLTSVFLLSHAFVPTMKGQGYGRILNLTSIMSHVAIPGRTAYCASKTALLGFTRALALELATEKITVNGISPGPFATEMNKPLMENEEMNRQFLAKIPAGRWGDPDEVGRLALYLCSEDAGFITGQDVVIDGGWCAQ